VNAKVERTLNETSTKIGERVTAFYPSDRFFDRFEESCRASLAKMKTYRKYDDAFRLLDYESWDFSS
jgi:hypothetical protein